MGNVICSHRNLTMQKVRGPKYRNTRMEFGIFGCVDCNLFCYCQRELGFVYNGAWESWIPSTDNETMSLGALQQIGSLVVCHHTNLQVKSIRVFKGFETKDFVCSECGMNCTRTRLVGVMFNGFWQKLKTN